MTAQKKITVTARNIQPSGRMVLSAYHQHMLIDAPNTLDGPHESITPLDMLLGSLATSACFVCERAAEELGIPLLNISGLVEAVYNEDAVRELGEEPPKLQSVRLSIAMLGITHEQGETLSTHIKGRCPVYATLSAAVEIELVLVTN